MKFKNLLSRAARAVLVRTDPQSGFSLKQRRELHRLSNTPRYSETWTDLFGTRITVPDGPSFASAWRSVFGSRIYAFRSGSTTPRVLDCGANVGLASIFVKSLYPQARITAFEPDPKIILYLQENLRLLELQDVEVITKAVWSSATTLGFQPEGADSGRLASDSPTLTTKVETTRLRDFLSEPVDFLKMDIEGAETEVIKDCANRLSNVRNIFLEYHSFAGKPQTLPEVLSILQFAGFRLHLHTELSSPSPFMDVRNYLGMDLQLNLFGYRESPYQIAPHPKSNV